MAEAWDTPSVQPRAIACSAPVPARRIRLAWSAGAAAAGSVAALLLASLLWQPRPLLVWNVSASAPVGLYAVVPAERIRPGEMVIAWMPEPARTLAADRHYLPSNVPLVKRVAAAAGDRVCAIGEAVWVNGRHVAARLEADRAGRPMPRWTGCRELTDGDFFLLMARPGSFDGRYFGISRREELVGRAVMLWAR